MPDSDTSDDTKEKRDNTRKKIAVVGAGWFGVHTALELAKECFDVHLYDANEKIFGGISGSYGLRLHKGLHYPLSAGTQASCRAGYDEFIYRYPGLLVSLKHAVYAYKGISEQGIPSKASETQFRDAAQKAYYSNKPKEIKVGTLGYPYTNVDFMYHVPEPVLKTGEPLRNYFMEELAQAGVTLHLGTKVSNVAPSARNPGLNLHHNCSDTPEYYDKVVNATAYKALLPKDNSDELCQIRYQPLVSIVYRQKNSGKPITFIVMDLNDYPCFMHRAGGEPGEHILTHAKWTTLGSYKTLTEAEQMVRGMNPERYDVVRQRAEASMRSFYPTFLNDFEFVRVEPAVIMPKIRSQVEFRSALVFQDSNGVIHELSGKVSNVFDAADQVIRHVKGESLLSSPLGNFHYTESSPLKEYYEEVTGQPIEPHRSTCDLHPYPEWENLASEEEHDAISPIPSSSSIFSSSSSSNSSSSPSIFSSSGSSGTLPSLLSRTPSLFIKRFGSGPSLMPAAGGCSSEDSSLGVSPRVSPRTADSYSSLSTSSSFELSLSSSASGSDTEKAEPLADNSAPLDKEGRIETDLPDTTKIMTLGK